MKFNVDHYILGDSYRCAWAVREYPPTTSAQAILARFGEREGVTLRIYSRMVDAAEQRKVIQNATRKNRMLSTSNDVQETINAEGNMEDVVELLANTAPCLWNFRRRVSTSSRNCRRRSSWN